MKRPHILFLPFILLTALLSACGDDSPTVAPQAEAVDLGLSVLWADRNLGAANADGLGRHYGWADSAGLHPTLDEKIVIRYTGEYSFFCDWHSAYFGGLNPPADISATTYDAARYAWNGSWRLPTAAEMRELVEQCQWELVGEGRERAYRITGPNGASITLPLAGFRTASFVEEQGHAAYYWTSSLLPRAQQAEHGIESNCACAAWSLVATAAAPPNAATAFQPQPRNYALSIRPVRAR